ncbi:hypothetical protein [Bradyrhizobium sp. NAS96.2]|uniref:hypothetical protein n=1 Tax=Bradyrhizobium sp. NAS96.2 TaxID=1680160 RepID=UPI001160FA34|nr:hypothetical protein [Bradyrhizobium sp. NAS96.2]
MRKKAIADVAAMKRFPSQNNHIDGRQQGLGEGEAGPASGREHALASLSQAGMRAFRRAAADKLPVRKTGHTREMGRYLSLKFVVRCRVSEH